MNLFDRVSRCIRSRGQKRRVILSVELVEDRVLLASFTVITADDVLDPPTDPKSLRDAIMSANHNPGPDTIVFDIPGPGLHTINLTSSLPPIKDRVTIDGYTQPGASPNTLAVGNNAVLLVEVNGASAGTGVNGLTIALGGGGSTVRGLVINRFSGSGIQLDTSGNAIAGNFIGTDVTGTMAEGNGVSGLSVFSSNNTIGGPSPAARNLISGNGLDGIDLTNSAATGNVVQGNSIGTDITGGSKLGNARHGVAITSVTGSGSPSGSNNTIGGLVTGAGNVISGNGGFGVVVFGPDGGATGNVVQGNLIGTDASGEHDLGNTGDGVVLSSAANNTVGGTDISAQNVISGSGRYGVVIESSTSTGNLVRGDLIGTDKTGATAISNVLDGVIIQLGASDNTVGGAAFSAGNLISGNIENGVEITGAGTAGNLVAGNRIGTRADGNAPLPNHQAGVSIASSATSNTIGGPGVAGNVISGNTGHGIDISSGGNFVQGNYIGTNASGASLANDIGVEIDGLSSNSNLLQDNFIDFNAADGVFVNAASGNHVVGNTIAGNGGVGVQIFSGATANMLQGNTIASNGTDGVFINAASHNQTVGNTITGNTSVGVQIFNSATGNMVQGNTIASNGTDGVFVNAASGNFIGQPGQGNLISGNRQVGVQIFGGGMVGGATNNVVQGNTITDNGLDGVAINSASGNTIGGNASPPGTLAGNIITGNKRSGVNILLSRAMGNSTDNSVLGNIIQDNNGFGIALQPPVKGNVIGGLLGAANDLSGPVVVYAGGRSRNRIGRNMLGPSTARSVGHRSTPERGHGQRPKVR